MHAAGMNPVMASLCSVPMSVICTLAWKASCLLGLPIIWGLSGLGRKRGVGPFRDDTESRQLGAEGKFLSVRPNLGVYELPLFLLVSLFGMRPTAQPTSINKQSMTLCPFWLQLSKQRKVALS